MASVEFTTPGTYSWTAPIPGGTVEPYADSAYSNQGWVSGTDFVGTTGVFAFNRSGIQQSSGGARTTALPELKGYFEILISTTTPVILIGLARDSNTGGYNGLPNIYLNNGAAYGGLSGGTALGGFASGDTLQIAYDAALNQVWLGRNNTYYRSTALSGATIPGTGDLRCVVMSGTSSTVSCNGTFRRGENFVYSPPTGFIGFSPPGPYEVSVVAVGGGGSGGAAYWAGGGGGGGGLGWKNNISVTSGQSYTVVVGAGGVGVTANSGGQGTAGGDSYFIDLTTVAGLGGAAGVGTSSNDNLVYEGGTGGSFVGDGGGAGGTGGSSSGDTAGGGGGAAGYTGNGGDGGLTPTAGSGGGAAGGRSIASSGTAGSGGGVGINGEGISGTGPGAGGSGGTNGSPTGTAGGSTNTGGAYGGGGGGQSNDAKTTPGCDGGTGAVRIFYPSTDFLFPAGDTAAALPIGIITSTFNTIRLGSRVRTGLLSSTSVIVAFRGSSFSYELFIVTSGSFQRWSDS